MFVHRSVTQFLVVNIAIVLLGISTVASVLLLGFRNNCLARSVIPSLFYVDSVHDTFPSDPSEQDYNFFPTYPESEEQYPAVSLISRIEDSDQVSLPKIRCLGLVTTFLSDRHYRPKAIWLYHCVGNTLVIVNCAFLI
jgi:hypothetical protein